MSDLPKCDCREEVHSAFASIDVKTTRDEPFIFHNDSARDSHILSCKELGMPLFWTDLVIGGTFKFFHHIYNIRGLRNGHYVPFVFTLLSDRTQTTYKYM